MHTERSGAGAPLLLVHGLGGSWRSWTPILDRLSREREVIAIDLPGHGATPRLPGPASVRSLADALTRYLREQGLLGVDAVGSSMGARLVLELARRGGVLGGVVSLNPGGFWRGWERHVFFASTWTSIRAVRWLQPVMPQIANSRTGRTLLLQQLSPRPWRLPPSLVLDEMRSYAATPVFDELLHDLAYGEEQRGAVAGSISAPAHHRLGPARSGLFRAPGRARAGRCFPMRACTGSIAAGTFRSGTSRSRPPSSFSAPSRSDEIYRGPAGRFCRK